MPEKTLYDLYAATLDGMNGRRSIFHTHRVQG